MAHGLRHHVVEFAKDLPHRDDAPQAAGRAQGRVQGGMTSAMASEASSAALSTEPATDFLPPATDELDVRPVVVLVHGYMDAAGTWDLVAPHLVREGYRVLAPDMRGFGQGPHAPPGSYYHFFDYVADLAEVVDTLAPQAPLHLVGHSMGGAIVTYFAGAWPGRVLSLALMEGLGPPDAPLDSAPDRLRQWVDDLRALRTNPKASRRSARPEDAFRRLVLNHPNVPPDVLRGRLPHLVRTNDDGSVTWHFDPLHRTTAPTPFFADVFATFCQRVACPVLFLGGQGPSAFRMPDEAERLRAFPKAEKVEIPGAGHMMHWSHPEDVGFHLARFLRQATGRGGEAREQSP